MSINRHDRMYCGKTRRNFGAFANEIWISATEVTNCKRSWTYHI